MSSPSTKNGIVRVNGIKTSEFSENFFVPEGCELGMEVDLKKLVIRYRNYTLDMSWNFTLPEVFGEKNLYAFLAMGLRQDCIEVAH